MGRVAVVGRAGVMALALLSVGHESRATVAWPTTLWFQSLDHAQSCPPPVATDPCVDGYILELWRQSDVGVAGRLPLGTFGYERTSVTLTGDPDRPYALPLRYPPGMQGGVPYVWTLRATRERFLVKSARSAPTPEVVILPRPVRPATAGVR